MSMFKMKKSDMTYLPCDHDHLPEFRTDEECGHDRHHKSELELARERAERMTEGQFRKLTSWGRSEGRTRSYREFQGYGKKVEDGSYGHPILAREAQSYRLLRTVGDGQAVTVGIDAPRWTGKAVRLKKQVMPSQTNRTVRSCSGKLARAEFYGPRWHRKRGRGGTSEVDMAEYDRLMKELGI